MDSQQGRIAQLEQALDQTLGGLAEARSALAEQAYLEAHLAEVEETANVQWQAIIQLKRQLLPGLDEGSPAGLLPILATNLTENRSENRLPNPAYPLRGHAQGAVQEQLAGLEAELAKQMQTQALLQQACLELEAERSSQQARLAELEQQSVDMQEQILSQAQQASEDETAIQHWKDRVAQGQAELTALRELLAQTDLLPS